ncbi:MAG: hypothetical protein ACSHXY_01300 [Alphaproteobacteria bacterium]
MMPPNFGYRNPSAGTDHFKIGVYGFRSAPDKARSLYFRIMGTRMKSGTSRAAALRTESKITVNVSPLGPAHFTKGNVHKAARQCVRDRALALA